MYDYKKGDKILLHTLEVIRNLPDYKETSVMYSSINNLGIPPSLEKLCGTEVTYNYTVSGERYSRIKILEGSWTIDVSMINVRTHLTLISKDTGDSVLVGHTRMGYPITALDTVTIPPKQAVAYVYEYSAKDSHCAQLSAVLLNKGVKLLNPNTSKDLVLSLYNGSDKEVIINKKNPILYLKQWQ